ncbi:H(+)-exporting diphosphatase [Heracleum sosnowskyi]|uniref:H(+)-exporting diphosphatase n=1 Tax=Heracleum sosnowskyi TaxID=360622 RepID=A0AAD8IPB6_9APIA|nr:H(+)-exporting diphosphatase [Heracleum sosnowskyi]
MRDLEFGEQARSNIEKDGHTRSALKEQHITSTILMTVGVALVRWIALPSSFTIFNFGTQKVWQLFLCVYVGLCVGLWAGLIIDFVTEYYINNAYSPVQDIVDSCRIGAATNVIFGLALGYTKGA